MNNIERRNHGLAYIADESILPEIDDEAWQTIIGLH